MEVHVPCIGCLGRQEKDIARVCTCSAVFHRNKFKLRLQRPRTSSLIGPQEAINNAVRDTTGNCDDAEPDRKVYGAHCSYS
jgi:hypothetical protein